MEYSLSYTLFYGFSSNLWKWFYSIKKTKNRIKSIVPLYIHSYDNEQNKRPNEVVIENYIQSIATMKEILYSSVIDRYSKIAIKFITLNISNQDNTLQIY